MPFLATLFAAGSICANVPMPEANQADPSPNAIAPEVDRAATSGMVDGHSVHVGVEARDRSQEPVRDPDGAVADCEPCGRRLQRDVPDDRPRRRVDAGHRPVVEIRHPDGSLAGDDRAGPHADGDGGDDVVRARVDDRDRVGSDARSAR